MEIKKIFVMGAGLMGSGISQVVAQAGYEVTMEDVSQEVINSGLATIDRSLSRGVKKGTITEKGKANIVSRIRTTTDLRSARDADLVIEAIPEVLDVKREAFRKLDSICLEHTILGSNTSALSITAIAAATKRQPKVIGIHFMNPAPVMKGVEIIPGRHTSEETLQASKDFVKTLGKEPCEVVDYTGFVLSRIIDAMMNEAFYCVMDGNKPEEVDKIMKLCANFPLGPLELCDLIGADIVLHALQAIHEEFGPRFLPAPLLVSMVRSGDLGRKTGRGFYDYTKKG